jgi:hypothetical protein
VLLITVGLTVMAVAWTGWRALRDLELIERQLDLDPEPVVVWPRLRALETTGLSSS